MDMDIKVFVTTLIHTKGKFLPPGVRHGLYVIRELFMT